MTDARKNKLKKILQGSRNRLLLRLGGFTLPLGVMLYVATNDVERMSTNGHCIYFDPNWLLRLDERGVDFMIAHQLMHIHLGHVERPAFYRGDRFHLACDIVANSYLDSLGFADDSLPSVGKIYKKTFYPEVDGNLLFAKDAVKYVPFDPATLPRPSRRNYMIDSDKWWEKREDRGEHGVIVLSEDDLDFMDTLLTPNINVAPIKVPYEEFDTPWHPGKPADSYRELIHDDWERITSDSLSLLKNLTPKTDSDEPLVCRVWERVDATGLDWKTVLGMSLCNELYDYSFVPPDKRYNGTDIFMPDFNVCERVQKDVAVFVDTSASVDKAMLGRFLSEICSIVLQLGASFNGKLYFFDSVVYPPITIESVGTLLKAVPVGGGGTDYSCIFNLQTVKDNIGNVIIFTDGGAPFPDSNTFGDIPLIWAFTRPCVAPFGKSIVIN